MLSPTAVLLSTSTRYGQGYLAHGELAIRQLIAAGSMIAFVPYALKDRDEYARKVAAQFDAWGMQVCSVHHTDDPVGLIRSADAIFVGGGNTFRLLTEMYRVGLIDPIKEQVAAGTPYLGSSAGTVVACPTITTTNDMPIVYPPTFESLGLVSLQINPHFLDAPLSATHMGETRSTRLRQYCEDNHTAVIGLPEGSWLELAEGHLLLSGTDDAIVFSSEREPVAVPLGADLATFGLDSETLT